MRRSWIKIETNTPDKPEVCMIASQVRMDSDAVMGKLVRLWAWAELNVTGDNETTVTLEFLDKLVGKKGFSASLIKAGWLKVNEERLEFPNFNRHNGREAKSRAQTALRVSRHRAQKANVVTSVTTATLSDKSPIEVPELKAMEPADSAPISHEALDSSSTFSDTTNHLNHAIETASELDQLSDSTHLKEISVTEANSLIAETLAHQKQKPQFKKRSSPKPQEEELQLLF